MALSLTGTVTAIIQNPAQPAPMPTGASGGSTTPPDPGCTVTVTLTPGSATVSQNNGMAANSISFQKTTADANAYKIGQAVTFTGSI